MLKKPQKKGIFAPSATAANIIFATWKLLPEELNIWVRLKDANKRQMAPTYANWRQQAKMRQQKRTKMRQQKD